MASSVNVLCPNGHRVTVKVTPTTSVLHIVEEVCKKKGFDANQFSIKSEAGKAPIDVTLQIRYANLPNNAKLELIKAEIPRAVAGSQVSVSLQMPDGARLKPTDFQVDASLWEVIAGFENQEGYSLSNVIGEGMEPVVVYMRDQICGESQLKKTTLKAIGLISGRGLLRLNKREKSAETRMEVEESLAAPPAAAKAPATSSTFDDPLSGVKLSQEHMKMIDSISEGYREYQRETGEASGPSTTQAALAAAPSPFAAFPGPSRDFLPSFASPAAPVASTSKTSSPPVAVVRPQMEFADFKFPERDEGASGGTDSAGKSLQDNSSEPCDREIKVFNLDVIKEKTSQSESSMEVDDDFFDLTINDLRSRMAELQRTTSDDAPLLTSAMRERREEAKFSNYHRTLIRVHFPDKMVLQGMFRLRETVGALYEFVGSNLESPKMPFYLYVAPPKQELKDKSLTMMKAGLAPAANVYFGSKNGESRLSKQCLGHLVTEQNLQRDLARLGQDSNTDLDPEKKRDERDFSPPAKRPQTDAKGKATGGAGGKMPKWFSAGKKK